MYVLTLFMDLPRYLMNNALDPYAHLGAPDKFAAVYGRGPLW